jgi:DNA-directed RNA polymerase specialized sigma24 family protein
MDEHSEDLALAKACLNREESAWERLGVLYRTALVSALIARGALRAEAEDLVSDLWLDLGGFGTARDPLLSRFAGTGPLRAWLHTVVLMRFIGQRRRKRPIVDLRGRDSFEELVDRTVGGEERGSGFPDLAEAVRGCLLRAWRRCPAELRLMLQLVHVEAISQREIAALWGWHESKVCRALDSAMRAIRKETLTEFAVFDPEAALDWRDLLDLGNHYESLFAPAPDGCSGNFRSSSCGIA